MRANWRNYETSKTRVFAKRHVAVRIAAIYMQTHRLPNTQSRAAPRPARRAPLLYRSCAATTQDHCVASASKGRKEQAHGSGANRCKAPKRNPPCALSHLSVTPNRDNPSVLVDALSVPSTENYRTSAPTSPQTLCARAPEISIDYQSTSCFATL